MARIRIKQLNERVATMGLHMGGGRERRKLEPGEIVEIPEDLVLAGDPDERTLMEVLWDTNCVDLTLDKPTRPLDYENSAEAKLCSPSFKAHDPSEEVEAEKARTRVVARLEKQFASDAEKPKRDKSASKSTAKKSSDGTAADRGNRRALRRQTLEQADGEAATA